MAHDQLFKELLAAFFREFMELFFPDIAVNLDFSRIAFLDKETFTDLPKGDQREADLVVQVVTLEGNPEIILTHIEVEARRRSSFPERMNEYYRMLMLRYRLPTFPIVVYLAPGAGGITSARHEERVFGREVNTFTYYPVGLPDLSADDYLDTGNPLAPALGALMRTSRLGRVAQKYRALREVAQAHIDEARKALLTNVVETYLLLEVEESAEFAQLMALPEGEEVREMISIYEQRGIEKGIEQGIEKGIEQGIEQGIVRGRRQTLLRQMVVKFGDLPPAVREYIESIADGVEMDRLTDLVVRAGSLEEMGIHRP